MSKKIQVIFIGLILSLLWGCQQGPLKWESFVKEVFAEPYLKQKKVGDIELNLQYLPGAYLAYQELHANDGFVVKTEYDSVLSTYGNTLSFIFSLSSENHQDLLVHNTRSYQELTEKLLGLNFLFQDAIYLKDENENIIQPEGVVFDNSPHAGNKLKWTIVFDKMKVKESFPGKELKVVFEDPYWKTGRNYFTMNIKDLESLPQLKIQ